MTTLVFFGLVGAYHGVQYPQKAVWLTLKGSSVRRLLRLLCFSCQKPLRPQCMGEYVLFLISFESLKLQIIIIVDSNMKCTLYTFQITNNV